MVMFSLIVKTAAAADGLLPSGDNLRRFLNYFTLERGLVIGATVALASLLLAGYSLYFWISSGLSQLDPRQVMRVVIPALTFGVIGMETMFSSFALSFLRWKIDPS
jgi:hypothetical protein